MSGIAVFDIALDGHDMQIIEVDGVRLFLCILGLLLILYERF